MPPLFTASELVTSYAPTPLGEKLDLFLRLVKDLHTHAGEYANNFLSTLSPSLLSSYQEESVQQLITALSKGETTPATPEKRDESFWQARLLLQLAEDIRADEIEMAGHLAKVSNMQQRMLQSLRDDDGDELPPMPAMPSPSPRLPVRDDLLCRAWCRLFLADRNGQRPALTTTANSEAAELFIDTYSQGNNQEPVTICDLPLPNLSDMDEEDFLGRRNEFHKTMATLRNEIGKTMETAMATGQVSLDSEKTTSRWENGCAQHFGKEQNKAGRLRITLLAGATMADLCRRLSKSEEKTPVAGAPHTVLVHLSPLF